MFNSKKKSSIGLDISDLNLKAVQLASSGNKINIQALGRVNLPKGIIERGSIKDRNVVINALKSLFDKPSYGSFNTNQVVACLPETRTFIKLIYIEKGPNNLSDIIESEVEKYVPLSISEIYYDWQIIKESDDRYEILIGAAPQHIVNQYIDILQSAKLEVSALEIEAMPICRSLLAEESQKVDASLPPASTAIIDIGAKRTSLIIYADNAIAVTLSLPISGEEITDRIASTLEINKDQAEKAKIICGLDKNNAHGIINNILSDMIRELTGCLVDATEYFSKNYPNLPTIKKIYTCGGGSNIKSLEEILSQNLNLEVVKGNPFANITETEEKFGKNLTETHNLQNKDIIDSKGKLTVKQSSSLSYATAIGLSLRNIFLIK
jgi:type IV pilus assembly protein PilM